MSEWRRGYLPSGTGFVSVTEFLPASPRPASVLLAPPFGEEMNCCRRIMATLGRRLATAGLRTVYFDFRGTGESSGRLEELTAEDWVNDLITVREALAADGCAPISIVAVRLGALIATTASARAALAPLLLTWQPVLEGEAQLRDLAQQRALGDRMRGQGAATAADHLTALEEGTTLDVGGYRVSAPMAKSLRTMKLEIPSRELQRRIHIRVVSGGTTRRPEETGDLAACATGVRTMTVDGPAYWLQADSPLPEELLRATKQILLH